MRRRVGWPLLAGPASLKGRLVLLAALVLAAGLALFAMQLSAMFRQHVERSARAELEMYQEQLIVALQRRADGSLGTNALLPDPRFMRPLSGRYWQVNDADGHVLARSRSLWDATLPAPSQQSPNSGATWFETAGPAGERLLVLARRVSVPASMLSGKAHAGNGNAPGDVPLVFLVARDMAEMERAAASFNRELFISLGLLAGVLLLALTAQAWLGLKPLAALRRQVADIRHGRRDRLDAPAAAEIDALVEELNVLLAQQRRHMEQARARAGNLAHGLKTPLAALTAVARDLVDAGREREARAVLEQVMLLRRQVEHELSRARVRGGRGTQAATPLEPAVRRLLKTVRRLQGNDRLRWETDVSPALQVRMEEGDLLELLGNLMDNAAKWARQQVRVRAVIDDGDVALTVEDDGPGVPAHERERILQRGVRLDQNVPGSGIGLSIVQEIVEAYGGRLTLGESALGGLAVTVHLPAAESSANGGGERSA